MQESVFVHIGNPSVIGSDGILYGRYTAPHLVDTFGCNTRRDANAKRLAEAIDATSVAVWGRRSQGYGFPTYVVCDSAGFTQQLAEDILAGTANIVNRVERVTFNTRSDPNWWDAGKKFEIGSQVIVRRYHPRLIEFNCTIIGLDWIFNEDGYIEGNINLSTLDQTVKE